MTKPTPVAILSPSSLARYFFHDCHRFLKLRTTPRAARRGGGQAGRFDGSAVMEALQERGYLWEEAVIGRCRPRPLVARGDRRLSDRYHTVEASLALLRGAATRPLYQPTLRPSPGALGIDPQLARFADVRPDLILVERAVRTTRFTVVDIKSATQERFTQKIQVYLYARLLAEIVADSRIKAEVNLAQGQLWLGQADEPTAFSFADLAPPIEAFLAGDLPRILRAHPADVAWHLQQRCEWCDHYAACRSEAETTRNLALVPGLTATDKAFLKDQFGASTVAGLAKALTRPKAALTLAGSAGLRGRRVELQGRANAIEKGQRQETNAASPFMPRGQDIALHLTLVPDNLTRGVAVSGYCLTQSKRATQALGSAAKPAMFIDSAAMVRALHACLSRVAAWNAERAWAEQLSLMPFVYSNRERDAFVAILLAQLADPSIRSEALDLLLLLEGSELTVVEEAGDQPAQALSVVILASEIARLFAIPAPLAPTLPEVADALLGDAKHAFSYERHGLFDYPVGLALRDEALHKAPDPQTGQAWLESRVRQRLFAQRALVWRVQELASERLPTWPAKFAFWSGRSFLDARLAQLTFVTRYESVADCETSRAVRFQGRDQLCEGDVAVRLKATGDGWFTLLAPSGGRIAAEIGSNHWLVADSPEGRRTSVGLRDYRFGLARRTRTGGLWCPPPPPSREAPAVVVEAVETDDGARPARLRLRAEPKASLLSEAGAFFLFPRFLDFNTVRVVDALAAMDATPQSPVHAFLADSAAFARPLAASPTVRARAVVRTTKLLRSADQRRALETLLARRMTLLIGPPGTGKTFTLARLIDILVHAHHGGELFSVLVTAFTHAAIDELHAALAQVVDAGRTSLVRIRREPEDPYERSDVDAACAEAHELGRGFIACATTYSLLRAKSRATCFDLVVVDEASQLRLSEAMLAVHRLKTKGRLLLCGDDQQLGPIFRGAYPDAMANEPFDPTASVFMHALRALDRRNPDRDHPARVSLQAGRRMNDVLTSVPARLIYAPELGVTFVPADAATRRRRLALKPARRPLLRTTGRNALAAFAEHVLAPELPLVVLEVDYTSQERESPVEAAIVGALARALKDRLVIPERSWACTSDSATDEKGLFVVAPHHVQIAAIRREVMRDYRTLPRIDTVEKMQGRTCEVVIVSYGVSDPEVAMTEDAFIYDRNRLNVALSRARTKAVLVVSKALLSPPPRIVDRPAAARGFAYLRQIIEACAANTTPFKLELCGETTSVRLLGLATPIQA